jgi:hypothetical protein
MKIGIEVNGVLRDTIGKFAQLYEKHMISELDNDDQLKTFNIDYSGNTEEISSLVPFKYEIKGDVESLNLMDYFAFQSDEEYYTFMYEEFAMGIFGHASSTEMTSFNYLNDFYTKNRKKHDIYIISDEIGKSKPATLFFLSKFGCLIEKIIFYSEQTKDKILNQFDLIVTSNPEILINYKNRIELVKFETVYNKNINRPNTIITLKDLDTLIEQKYAKRN